MLSGCWLTSALHSCVCVCARVCVCVCVCIQESHAKHTGSMAEVSAGHPRHTRAGAGAGTRTRTRNTRTHRFHGGSLFGTADIGDILQGSARRTLCAYCRRAPPRSRPLARPHQIALNRDGETQRASERTRVSTKMQAVHRTYSTSVHTLGEARIHLGVRSARCTLGVRSVYAP